MKFILISMLTLLMSTSVMADHHEEMDHKNHKMHKGHGKKMSNNSSKEMHDHKHGESNQAFNDVLKEYEGLHSAFFKDDIKKINENAKEVLNKIEKIEDKKIAKTLTYTKKKLNEIIKEDDIEKKREAMNTVSQGLLVVLEKHAPNENYSRYYCPMVKKYWIQNVSKSEKVVNPYAGSYMPHCGTKK